MKADVTNLEGNMYNVLLSTRLCEKKIYYTNTSNLLTREGRIITRSTSLFTACGCVVFVVLFAAIPLRTPKLRMY